MTAQGFFVLAIIVIMISAFLNNTPIVIIFAPIVKKWAENRNMSAQKFLIPLSYATILGGVCTLIETSTNLVVQDFGNYKFKDFVKVGLPFNLIAFLISISLIPFFWKF